MSLGQTAQPELLPLFINAALKEAGGDKDSAPHGAGQRAAAGDFTRESFRSCAQSRISSKLSGGNSGGEPHAVQTLARPPGVSESREASGVRWL
jgi:hypothetical protein